MKKGIAVLLAALMLAGVWLVGCGERNPDELWAAAKENIVTTKSARLHMTMDMAFDLQGETTSMTMKMDEACTQDPLSAEVNHDHGIWAAWARWTPPCTWCRRTASTSTT